MNLYKASESFFRFFVMSAAPDTETANYAEQSAMAFENAENDFLADIILTEVMNTESVDIPKGFIETVFPREITGSDEAEYFPAAAAVNGFGLQGAAAPLIAEMLADYEKNMLADAQLLTSRDLTGNMREAVMINIERNIGAAAVPSLSRRISAAGEEKEMPSSVEVLYAVQQANGTAAKFYGNIYGKAVRTQDASAASAVYAAPPLICGGIVDRRALREKITSVRSDENCVINPAMSVLTEASANAAVPVTARSASLTAVLPPWEIDNENQVVKPTKAMTYTFEPREYSVAAQAGNPTFVFGGMLQIPSADGAAEVELTACASERISEKELNRLREGAAAGTGKQAEERIIREIRAGALNTPIALNTAPDTDNVIDSLTEALRQAAETGVEGVYR